MFRLMKLLAYGLLGYALYEFIRGAVDAEGGGGSSSGGGNSGGGGQSRARNMRNEAARANMTGPGQGETEATQDADGGSVRHMVGRGVVS